MLTHIADRVLNRPLLITRDKAQVVLAVLAGRIGVNTPDASRFEGEDEPQRDKNGNIITRQTPWGRVAKMKPYKVSNGVAIITITGSLMNRGAWVGASSGLTSYEGIGHQLKTVLGDDTVHSVILDLHSPGGEAVGAFETAALVRTLAAKKKTVAVVNGMAASAAYAIASGASEIVTTETGVSGSIGVVLLHADFSRQLDREGISPTLIHAGAHKVDGNPFEPLSADVKDDLQAEVNSFYEAFLKTVSKGRGGRLSAAAARKTEARTFIGSAAVDAGLADRVGSFESVLTELSRAGGRTTVQQRKSKMDYTDNDLAAARAEGEAAAYARINSILAIEGVTGPRVAHAIKLAALAPKMSAQEVADYVKGTVALSSPASLANRQQPDPLGSAANGPTPDADRVKQGWAKAFGNAEREAKQRVQV